MGFLEMLIVLRLESRLSDAVKYNGSMWEI